MAASENGDGRPRRVAAAERAVAESDAELARAVEALARSLREPFAIADRIRRRPLVWMVGAAVVGFAVARVTRDSSRSG